MIKINLKCWLDTSKVIFGGGIKSFSSNVKSYDEIGALQPKEDFRHHRNQSTKSNNRTGTYCNGVDDCMWKFDQRSANKTETVAAA